MPSFLLPSYAFHIVLASWKRDHRFSVVKWYLCSVKVMPVIRAVTYFAYDGAAQSRYSSILPATRAVIRASSASISIGRVQMQRSPKSAAERGSEQGAGRRQLLAKHWFLLSSCGVVVSISVAFLRQSLVLASVP